MITAVASIARFTLLEAWRTRVPLIVALTLAVTLTAALFAASLALTDGAAYRVQVYAALARLAMVLLATLVVAAALARELEGRLLDLTWSRPLSRAPWLLGRLGGFATLAVVIALAATVPLLWLAPPLAALAWGTSLAAELVLVAVATVTFSVTLRQLTLAVSGVLAFYLLARAMGAIALMSRGPMVDAAALSSRFIAASVDALGYLLPALDQFTQATWLSQGVDPAALGSVLLQAACYVLLLAAVGLFDVYRMDH